MLEHHFFKIRSQHLSQGIGFDRARCNRIDANSFRSEIKSNIAGEVANGGLRGAIRGHINILVLCRHRGDI